MTAATATDPAVRRVPKIPKQPSDIDVVKEHAFAEELKINVATLRRWHESGIGPARIKCGRQIFYRRTSILRWLESREGVRR